MCQVGSLLDPTTSNFDYSYSDSESNKGEIFSKCFEKVFFPRIIHTRETNSCRQRVTGSAKVLGDWQTFLKNANNKKELFTQSSMLSTGQLPDQKELYITKDDCVKHMAEGTPMGQCNHGEADTCILVHLLHAL